MAISIIIVWRRVPDHKMHRRLPQYKLIVPHYNHAYSIKGIGNNASLSNLKNRTKSHNHLCSSVRYPTKWILHLFGFFVFGIMLAFYVYLYLHCFATMCEAKLLNSFFYIIYKIYTWFLVSTHLSRRSIRLATIFS